MVGKPLGYWIILGLLWVCSEACFALPLVPMAYSGSLGYYYSYIKAEEAESETALLTATISGNGFVWQPWFVTLGIGLSIGYSDSNSNTGGGSSSTTGSGNLQFSVFPQSRFPFVLSLSVTDSRLENTAAAFTADDHFINYRLFMSQSYFSAGGSVARLSYDHNEFESDRSDSSSDNISASFYSKTRRHRYGANANYSTSERSNSDLKPENSLLEFQHDYSTGSDMSVSSLASYTENDSGVGGDAGVFQITQANSVFSWRPIDRPYTLSGGARIATSESGGGDKTDNLATNIGANYRLTRSLNVLALATISATDTDTTQTVTDTESVTVNYSSLQYFVGGFSWNWNAGAGFNNSHTSVDDDSESEQNIAGSLGQTLNRSWATGRNSTMNIAFSQNGSATKSTDADEPVYGLGNGVSLGWSRRGIRSSTYSSLSLSDSRSFGETDTSFQQLLGQLTQRNELSRVSSLSANVLFQANRLDSSEAASPAEPKSLAASLTYLNSRTFGIFPLRFGAELEYHKQFEDNGIKGSETLELENRFDYQIGLLTTNMTFRIMNTVGGATSESLTFSITRTF
ncbi:MAG TPA: hypothetical protein VIM41_10040 [Gammaproteobacteria bacterium]